MKKAFVGFLLTIALLGLFTAPVNAQQQRALSVFPAIQDKTVQPGEKTRLQIQVRNGSSQIISGKIRVSDYVISDNEGTPRLVEETGMKPKYGAASWVTPQPEMVTIPANDFITVDLGINVPLELSGCGHYAIVYFEPDFGQFSTNGQTTTPQSRTAITVKIGGLLNFQVNNLDCKENMTVAGVKAPSFLEYGPIKLQFDLLNTGDVHISPKGVVILSNSLGSQKEQKKLDEKRIFPEAAKNYEVDMGGKWMLGRYKVDLNAAYGNKGGIVHESYYVWVFPWKVVTAIILAIIIASLLVRNYFRNLSYKEAKMEKEIQEEHDEIARLKEELKKREE